MKTDLIFVVMENNYDYYAELFLSFKRPIRSVRTVEWYEQTLRDFGRIVGLDWPPTASHLLTFFESFKQRKLSESSCDTYFRAVRGFLNWLHDCGIIVENPLTFVDGPRRPKLLPKAPPQPAVARLFATLQKRADSWQDVRDLALFSVALDTGARIGELATLTVDQVDLTYQEIIVYGSKDHEERTLELGDETAAELSAWMKQRESLRPVDDLTALFLSDYRGKGLRPFTHWGMRQRLKFWQKRSGIKPFPFNGFRHAFAVYSLRNHADLLDIKEQMGHVSVKTTAIYLEVVDEGRKQRHRQTSPRRNLR
jgi:site-specific recombinase XerD